MSYPEIRSNELDAYGGSGVSSPIRFGFLGPAERGPTSLEEGAPAVIRSESDVDRVLGNEASGGICYVIKRLIASGGEVRFVRVVASGTKGSLTLRKSGGEACLVVYASSPGAWSDDVTIAVEEEPGTTDRFRLVIAYAGQSGFSRTYSNLSLNPDRQEYAERVINGVDPLITVDALVVSGRPAVSAAAPLAGGASDDVPDAADYTSALSLLDGEMDLTHILSLDETGEVWAAKATYAAAKGTILDLHFVSGLTAAEMLLFRQGSGGYGADYIDSSFTALYWGDPALKLTGSSNTTFFTGLGEVGYNYGTTWRNNRPWWATAGIKRGVIKGAKGVRYNVCGRTEYQSLCNAQVNSIIWDREEGKAYIGDMMTAKRQETLLQQIPIRETVNGIKRQWRKVAKQLQFDPNDPSMWRALYEGMKTLLDDMGKTSGVDGFEGEGWFYQGDQNCVRRQQAKFNRQADLASGLYKAQLGIVPTGTARQLELTVALSSTGATFSEKEV